MTRLPDPTEFDDTKIRVPDFQRTSYTDGTSSLSVSTKIVPAKLVEQVCPRCGGKGVVEVKVPVDPPSMAAVDTPL